MPGFCALMFVLMTLIWGASYWISWELCDSRTRPPFGVKVMRDCVLLLARRHRADVPGLRSPARGNEANRP